MSLSVFLILLFQNKMLQRENDKLKRRLAGETDD